MLTIEYEYLSMLRSLDRNLSTGQVRVYKSTAPRHTMFILSTLDGFQVYWGLTPPQQPGSYQGGEMMMMKSVIWCRKPEYPEETTDLRQVSDQTFHTHGLCRVRGLNLGRSGVKQSELRRDESSALAHRATAVPWIFKSQQEKQRSLLFNQLVHSTQDF